MSACVVWTGAFHEGYPMLGNRRAHRVAYEAMTPRVHMLLHRSWEKSHAKARAQDRCRHGHKRDGWRMIHGVRRRYCRTCHNAPVRLPRPERF